jgi:fatty acid synthase
MSDAIVSLQPKVKSGELSVSINLQNESMKYLSGHVIDGRNLFPATGYLVSIISLSHPEKEY